MDTTHLQILTSEGICTDPTYRIDDPVLRTMYQCMLQTRLFDQKAVALQRTGRLRTFPSSLGQEAIYAVIGTLMHAKDILCPYYRDQAALIQRGTAMEALLRYWGGDERGNQGGSQVEDFPICVPIASQCLHAIGVAYAMVYQNRKQAVVCTIGDGGTSKGDFYEAMNMASIHSLPVIFVINNNQWAISTPVQAQTATNTFAQKAKAAGIEGISVDGNDVFALHKSLTDALQKAYTASKPTVIEAITYRLCDHTTADDATRYTDKTALDQAWKQEPMLRLRRWLTEQRIASEQQINNWEVTARRRLEQAVKEYLATPMRPNQAIISGLYAHPIETIHDL